MSGRYRFDLALIDSSGLQCDSASVTVIVIPDTAISVELTWDNPSDPDQMDLDGTDLNLHLVKMPSAWFDPVHDVHSANPVADWLPEEAWLDFDDTDGAGPALINLNGPESCRWYSAGVSYLHAGEFGTAWPTIRVFINGRLVDEIVNQPLEEGELWDAVRIHWPSGAVYRVNEVTPEFPTDRVVAVPVTDDMLESGLCD